MKKAISLFLAALLLCLATSAMATPSVSLNGDDQHRNSTSSLPTSPSAAMACFRPGDKISFTVSGVTSSNELTVISYKVGSEGSLSDSNVQYINQYTLSSSSQSISYTIRNQDKGKYVIKINDSTGTVATFYYKVGDATVLLQQSASTTTGYGTPYISELIPEGKPHAGTYSIGFIGKVTVDSSDISLADIGANPGFEVKKGETTAKYGFGVNSSADGADNTSKTTALLDSVLHTSGNEIVGSYSIIYGLTMYNVPSGQQNSITAKAVLDADE